MPRKILSKNRMPWPSRRPHVMQETRAMAVRDTMSHRPAAAPPDRLPLLRTVGVEMRRHAPFTLLGAATGVAIMMAFVSLEVPRSVSSVLFWSLHPLHVLLSALVTTAMFNLHGRGAIWKSLLVGYAGAVGIATLSDCLIPYAGELLLQLPHRGMHLGFLEKWWLVNPMAALGIGVAYFWPHTRLPHAGHVLLSTWASLFHMTMAMGDCFGMLGYGAVTVFLFLAVWIPCCTSDILFPLLFATRAGAPGEDRVSPSPQ